MTKLAPFDEHLVHQIPEPLAVVGTDHPHWRESYFFAAHGPDVDTDVIVVSIATYPARHMLEALVLGRVDGDRLFIVHQREAGEDPHAPAVGPVSVEIVEPYRSVAVDVAPTGGFEASLRFAARTAPYGLRRGTLHAADGSLLWDQRHMIQSGVWEGHYLRGGVRREVAGWLGQRDHSWGVRDHGRIPMWLWLAIQLPDGMLGVWRWEQPDGAVVYTDGCWAPADGSLPVPVVDFSHDLHWTGAGGMQLAGGDGTGASGLAGDVVFTLDGGSSVTLSAHGTWCAPYQPVYGGGQFLMSVETADGRRGSAIYELTGCDHHRYFPRARSA